MTLEEAIVEANRLPDAGGVIDTVFLYDVRELIMKIYSTRESKESKENKEIEGIHMRAILILLEEARDLMENTHSYDSEIARRIDRLFEEIEKGTDYSKAFLTLLLYDSLELFERTNCEETETYEKINEYLEKEG